MSYGLFDEETGQRLQGRAARVEWNRICDGGRPPAPEPTDPRVVPALPDEWLEAMGWQEVIAPRWDADEAAIREFLGPAPTAQEAREVAECFGWDDQPHDDTGTGTGTGISTDAADHHVGDSASTSTSTDAAGHHVGDSASTSQSDSTSQSGSHTSSQSASRQNASRQSASRQGVSRQNASGESGDDPGLGAAELLAHADPDPAPRGWPRPVSADGAALPVGLGPRIDGEVADVGAHARRQADWQALYDLQHLDVDATDPYTLVEAVAAWRRQEALAGYHQRMLAFELAHRAQDLGGPPGFEAAAQATNPVAAAEVAFRLGITRQRARRLIDAGTAMAQGSGILVGIALQQGELDGPKADLIIERTAHLPMELALDVHDQVLPTAGLRTYPQLERDLATAIAKADPDGFSDRHARARTGRHISAPRALPDGMAAMRLVTSAADAMALHTALEAAARTAKNAGDERTLDQLRADALTTTAHTALATGHLGPCTTTCSHPGTSAADDAETHAADTTGDTDAHAGAAESTEPAHATEATGTAENTEPARATEATGTAENTEPAEAAEAVGADGHLQLGVVGGARAQVRITVPLSTLIGTSSDAAELEGYGPIPAEVARALAAGGTWKRLVTDPLTSRVIEATATRYAPPRWLREQVIANEPFCTAPGCNTQSRHGDIDHAIPFPHGPTAEWNLHPVCRHHHQLKTTGHLRYTSPQPGVHEWTTPTGHRYRTDLQGTHLLPPADTESSQGSSRAGSNVSSTSGGSNVSSTRAGPSRAEQPPARPPRAGPPRSPTYPTEDDPPPF